METQRNIYTLQSVDIFVFTVNSFTEEKDFLVLYSYNINFQHHLWDDTECKGHSNFINFEMW